MSGIPIPTIFLLGGLLPFCKPLYAGSRVFWILSGLSSLYLLAIALVNAKFNPLFGLKDIAYFALPIQFLFSYLIFYNVFKRRTALRTVFEKFCLAFIVFQAILLVCEYLNIGPIIKVFMPYMRWFIVNVSGIDTQLNYLSLRPGGTLGNPVLLGITGYIIGRHLSITRQNSWYLVLGFGIMMLTVSRTPFIGALLAEATCLALWPPKQVSRKILRDAAIGFVILLAGLASVLFFVPFMRPFLTAILSGGGAGLSNDESVSYRSQILLWASTHVNQLWFGGLSLAESPAAVDSEVIMRSLQFGWLGYLVLQFPVWCFVTLGFEVRNPAALKFGVILLVFCLFCSLTFSPFSYPYLLIWYGCLLAYWMADPTNTKSGLLTA